MVIRSGLFYIWKSFDPLYYYCTRLTSLAKQYANHHNVLRVRTTCYKGCEAVLSDGTAIKRNDVLIKIHLHNVRILKETKHFANELQKGKWIYRSIERSLPELVTFIKEHDKCDEIKGIIGITMLNRGSGRIGFETIEISSRFYKWFKWFIQFPILYLTTANLSWKDSFHHKPTYLFMSKAVLFEKYDKP